MKRAGVAALWIATIVVTWFVVRGQVDDRSPAIEEPVTTRPAWATASRSAPVRPTFAHHTPDPDDSQTFRTALAVLERDMADGRWSIEDRDRLTSATRRVRGEQATELYLVLFPKLNSGAVKSEIEGPPI